MVWDSDAGNITMSPKSDIPPPETPHPAARRIRSDRGLADIAVNDQQRHINAMHQRHNRFFAHIAGVKNNGVALAVGQHLYRFLFAFRRIVAVGHDQLFTVGFGLARSLLQQTAKIEAIECGNHRANAVTGAIRQRTRQKLGR